MPHTKARATLGEAYGGRLLQLDGDTVLLDDGAHHDHDHGLHAGPGHDDHAGHPH